MTKKRMDNSPSNRNNAQNNRGTEDPRSSSLSPSVNQDKKPAERIKKERAE